MVAVVSVLLIAPQSTEFWSKVGLLGGLTVMCAVRPILGRLGAPERGTVWVDPALLELTHRLSRRYLGPDGPRYAEHTIQRPRVLVRLEPVSWATWTGREWHPRYR